MKRDFISLQDVTQEELRKLLNLTKELKAHKGERRGDLKAKSIGLLFQKPSNRTRVSFEVGIWQLSGNCIYLSPDEINLGQREAVSDVAKTLSRYLDGLVARTNSHQDLIELGKAASIPVINGLSDLFHPCQALADIFSIQEKFGETKKVTVTYIGDGNNVCHSLLRACVKAGYHIRIATPPGYEPQQSVVAEAQKESQQTQSEILLTNSPEEAVKDSQVIYSDVWVSMGQESQGEDKQKDFAGFQINQNLIQRAHDDFIFMHCLPAHRGEEVTAEIIDGPHSIVFDQAENRMHAQKAVLLFLLSYGL